MTTLLLVAAFAGASVVPIAALSLPGTPDALDTVCVLSRAGWTDFLGPASNHVPADVPLASDLLTGGALIVMYGLSEPFSGLLVDVAVSPGPVGTVDWAYWDGSGWRVLAVTDGTVDHHTPGPGAITLVPPVDWDARPVPTGGPSPCPGSFYLVRETTGQPYVTPPLATRIDAIR